MKIKLKNNPVAKYAHKYNRSTIMIDRKKEVKKNPPMEKAY